MTLRSFTSQKTGNKYLAEAIGSQVFVYFNDKHIGDCWISTGVAVPRWFIQLAQCSPNPTYAGNWEDAAKILIVDYEKFLPTKGNPSFADTRKLLAAVRNEDRPQQRLLVAGRSAGERRRGVCID